MQRLNGVKMSVLPYLIYRCNSPTQNPCNMFCGYQHIDPQSYIERQRQRTINTISKEKKNKIGGLTLPYVKTYNNKKTVIKCDISRRIDNRTMEKPTENPEIKPHKYSQLIFHKGAKTTQWSIDSLFNKSPGTHGHTYVIPIYDGYLDMAINGTFISFIISALDMIISFVITYFQEQCNNIRRSIAKEIK